MANGSDFTLNFKAATEEIRKAAKEIKALHKEFQKSAQQLNKLQAGMHKERLKEVEDLRKAHQSMMRDQERSFKKLSQQKERVHRQELRSQQKHQRLQKRERTEQQRFERQQEGRARRRAREEGRGGVRRTVVGAGRTIAGAAGGMVLGAAQSAYAQYMRYGVARAGTIGLAPGADLDAILNPEGPKPGTRRAHSGRRLGFSQIEAAQQQRAMARTTGSINPFGMQNAMRAYGLDMGETSGAFATLRQAGFGFGGGKGQESAGARELRSIMEMGVAAGLERGRLPEFLGGVQKIVQQQANIATGVVDASGVARQLAALHRSGLPGLQGARGADLLGRVHGSFQKPGGGDFGENFMRMAMGFGKGVGYYEAEKRREKGLRDPKNLSRFLGEVVSQFGGGQEGALAIRSISGVSLERAEALLALQQSGATSAEKLEALEKNSAKSLSTEKQADNAMKGVGAQIKRIAELIDRAIPIGERLAPAIEKIEDIQFKLLTGILKIAKILQDRLPFGPSDAEKGVAAGEGQKSAILKSRAGMSLKAFRRDKITRHKASQERKEIATKGSGLGFGDTESAQAARQINYMDAAEQKAYQQILDWREQYGVSGPITKKESMYITRIAEKAAKYTGTHKGAITSDRNWGKIGGEHVPPAWLVQSWRRSKQNPKGVGAKSFRSIKASRAEALEIENEQKRRRAANMYGLKPGAVQSPGESEWHNPGTPGYKMRVDFPIYGEEGGGDLRKFTGANKRDVIVTIKSEDSRSSPGTRKGKGKPSRPGGR